MQDRIQALSAGQYKMYYHGGIDTAKLIPGLTLPEAIAQANTVLDHCHDTTAMTELEQDCVARMVRVKWIYRHLPVEPIRKPILVHREQDSMIVDCGDTRLMALSLLAEPAAVSVLTTCWHQHCGHIVTWQEICCESELFALLGFDPDSTHILYTSTPPGTPWAVSWLEIGDASTSHHLHDTRGCLDTLTGLGLGQFRFTPEWFRD